MEGDPWKERRAHAGGPLGKCAGPTRDRTARCSQRPSWAVSPKCRASRGAASSCHAGTWTKRRPAGAFMHADQGDVRGPMHVGEDPCVANTSAAGPRESGAGPRACLGTEQVRTDVATREFQTGRHVGMPNRAHEHVGMPNLASREPMSTGAGRGRSLVGWSQTGAMDWEPPESNWARAMLRAC